MEKNKVKIMDSIQNSSWIAAWMEHNPEEKRMPFVRL